MELEIGVRDLIAAAFPSGDLHSASESRLQALAGIQAHKAVQDSRSKEYMRELSISYRHELPDMSVLIRGRIDGFIIENDIPVIEEIKSTDRRDTEGPNEKHLAQAKLYAWMYAIQHKLYKITLRLTYYHFFDGYLRSFDFVEPIDELIQFGAGAVDKFAEQARQRHLWMTKRDISLKHLDFPHDTFRHGQQEFVEGVASAIKNGERLFARAPTGIGKTVAALYPAVKSLSEGICSKIFYLTARSTTREVAESCLRLLRREGAHIRSVSILAKSKACVRPDGLCVSRSCEYAIGYYERVPQVFDIVFKKGIEDLGFEELRRLADTYYVCPFELSLDLSLISDCIICDYNYVFDPRVYLRRYFMERLREMRSGALLLVDEAHNLVDRARNMFSAEVSQKKVRELKKIIVKEQHPSLYKLVRKVEKYLTDVKKELKIDDVFYQVAEQLAPELFELFEETNFAFREALPQLQASEGTDRRLLELYGMFLDFVVLRSLTDAGHVSTIESTPKDIILKLLCLDPAQGIRDKTDNCLSTIFFSATLAPIDYYRELLGGSEDDGEMVLPSPFPRKNLSVFLDTDISTRYRNREHSYGPIADDIKALAQAGNCMVFFSSFAYLSRVQELLEKMELPSILLFQSGAMDELARQAFLEEFVEVRDQPVLGLAVLGGIFSEGIDLPGERLSAVAVVGVGLPPVSREQDLMQRYFDERKGSGFLWASVYPGINRILQAAGRLIRSETDVGTLLFIGSRYGQSLYQEMLPEEYAHFRLLTSDTQISESIKGRRIAK